MGNDDLHQLNNPKLGKNKERALKFFLIFIIAFIPCILNRADLLSGILSNDGRFYWDLLVALFTTIIGWKLLRKIHNKLDKIISIKKFPAKRLLVQLPLTLFFLLLLVYSLYFIYSRYIFNVPLIKMISPSGDLLVIILEIIFVNLYFIGFDFYKNWGKPEEKSREQDKKDRFILVNLGQNTIPIKLDNIAAIYFENKHVFLLTFTHDHYLLTKSLNYYFEQLPGQSFFRINRQLIVHRKNITSFKNIENGKLEVCLANKEKTANISQKSAAKFRKWLKN